MKNNPKGIMYLNLNIPIIITSDGKIDLEEIAKYNFNPPIFLLGEDQEHFYLKNEVEKVLKALKKNGDNLGLVNKYTPKSMYGYVRCYRIKNCDPKKEDTYCLNFQYFINLHYRGHKFLLLKDFKEKNIKKYNRKFGNIEDFDLSKIREYSNYKSAVYQILHSVHMYIQLVNSKPEKLDSMDFLSQITPVSKKKSLIKHFTHYDYNDSFTMLKDTKKVVKSPKESLIKMSNNLLEKQQRS